MNSITRSFSVGTDERGNEIVYVQQPSGEWLNTISEQLVSPEFVAQHFSAQLAALEKPAKKSLLDLALEFSNKTQWSAGESVWIFGGPRRGAYLKEQHGFIHLCLVGIRASVPVFYLEPRDWQWHACQHAADDYRSWRAKVQEAVA